MSGNWPVRVAEEPANGGLSLFGERSPGTHLTVYEPESSKVSGNSLKYSRFWETVTGDWGYGAPEHVVIWLIGELPKRAVSSDRRLVAGFTVLLTAKTMHALFGPSRRKWIAL